MWSTGGMENRRESLNFSSKTVSSCYFYCVCHVDCTDSEPSPPGLCTGKRYLLSRCTEYVVKLWHIILTSLECTLGETNDRLCVCSYENATLHFRGNGYTHSAAALCTDSIKLYLTKGQCLRTASTRSLVECGRI
jgi:hypothetical protein